MTTTRTTTRSATAATVEADEGRRRALSWLASQLSWERALSHLRADRDASAPELRRAA